MNDFAPIENEDENLEETEDTETGIDESMLDEISEDATTPDDTEGFGHIDESKEAEKEEKEEGEESDDDPESLEEDAEDVDFDTFDDVDEL